MNPHYHHTPYPDLNSPHSPVLDGMPNNYHGHGGPQGGPPNGHMMNSHHEHLHSHPAFTGGPLSHHGNGPNLLQNYHHHHHHHLINHNSHNNGNNSAGSNQPHVNMICAACQQTIRDRWVYKALDKHWHQHCLKCSCCQTTLTDQGSCFTKENMILCKNDYLRMFCSGGLCASCNEQIPPNELVYKAAVSSLPNSPANNAFFRAFHMRCFSCCKCGAKLSAGDRYSLVGTNLYCEQDYNKFLKAGMVAGQQQTTGTTIRKGKVGRPRRSRD